MRAPAAVFDPVVAAQRSFLARVYAWMFAGLLLTAVVSVVVSTNETVVNAVVGSRGIFIGLLVGEVVLVLVLSAFIERFSPPVAMAIFLAYAALNGVTLSVIFLVFTAESLATTFFVTAGTFGVMGLYGYVTKRDLTSVGNLCFMALVGLILASVVNLFLRAELLYWITTSVGILIFVGLTAYDTQKLKEMGLYFADREERGEYSAEVAELAGKAAIMGALRLYLDFINLFLLLLRLFGRRR